MTSASTDSADTIDRTEADGDVGYWLRTAFQACQEGRLEEAQTWLEAAVMRFPHEAHVRHDLARLGESRKDWFAAERHWRLYVVMNPTAWWAHIQIARALREQGRMTDADALVADLRDEYRQEPWVFVEYARMAEVRGCWPEAAERWAAVADRFPETAEGLPGQARALVLQGKREEARTLLSRALTRFPDHADPIAELAKLEELDGNWAAAEQRWREFSALQPTVWWGHTRTAFALSRQGRMTEAAALLARALEQFPQEAGVVIEHARMAESQGDWLEAAARWDVVTGRFPSSWEGMAGRARVLRELKRSDEARILLLEAVDRFPAATTPLHDLARMYEADRNWPAAEPCWRDLVMLDPSLWWAHVGLAAALTEQGRRAEAEAVLAEQFEPMAQEPAVFIAHAGLADRAGDWEEAERRWSAVAERFPHLWDGFGGQVRSLRHRQRLEQARSVLSEAYDRFPDQPGSLRERAELAEALGEWREAEAAWRALVAIDQRFWWFHAHLIRAECNLGRIEEAFVSFQEARSRFPNSLDLLIDFARVLIEQECVEEARGLIADALSGACVPTAEELVHLGGMALQCDDLDHAANIMDRLRADPPLDPGLAEGIGHLNGALMIRRAELGLTKIASPGEPPAPVSADGDSAAERVRVATMMTRFESLGGDTDGYETGLVQRRCGVEPLGLLRWARAAPEQLVAALRSGLEGVGSLGQTELIVADDFYVARDTRFEMEMPTFRKPSEIAFRTMREQTIQRISFLRERLIQDLAQSDKIFVYRTLGDTMSLTDAGVLKNAMSLYGANRLLYIRPADAEHPVGSMTIAAPDLCVGYVGRFSDQPLDVAHPDGWLAVFQRADAHWSLVGEPAPVGPEAAVPTEAQDWPALAVAEAELDPAAVAQPAAKDRSWLRRAVGLFGYRARP